MKLVFINQLKPGMIIGQDVQLGSGSYLSLIKVNTVLTSAIIDRLVKLNVRFVYIAEKPSSVGDIITPTSKMYVPKPKHIITKRVINTAVTDLEDVYSFLSMESDSQSAEQVMKRIDDVVSELVDSLQVDRGAPVNIEDLKSYDEYTFHHSLSVAVLSIAIAQHLGFNAQELKRIGTCAIMHDIGKLAIPIEIIQKPSKLDATEFNIIKTHSPKGFDYLVKNKIGDDELLQGVLTHHEKYDGTGYPNGLAGDNIPIWGRIISLADVYDALTSTRPYRSPMAPAEALEYVMSGVGSAFDYDVVNAFVKKVELYPLGGEVVLNGDKHAFIMNNENTMRPVVRLADSGEIMDLYRDMGCMKYVITGLVQQPQ